MGKGHKIASLHVREVERSQDCKVTRSKGENLKKLQSYKINRRKGCKRGRGVKRSKGCKVTWSRGLKVIRLQCYKSKRFKGNKVARLQGREVKGYQGCKVREDTHNK